MKSELKRVGGARPRGVPEKLGAIYDNFLTQLAD